jgi:hypothetical protein
VKKSVVQVPVSLKSLEEDKPILQQRGPQSVKSILKRRTHPLKRASIEE